MNGMKYIRIPLNLHISMKKHVVEVRDSVQGLNEVDWNMSLVEGFAFKLVITVSH